MKGFMRVAVVAFLIAAIWIIVPALAGAQSFSSSRPGGRSGSWDFFLSPIYAESETVKGKGGSSVDLNDDWGFGFGFGYNFNDHFQLNGLFSYSDRSYDATVVQDDGTTQQYNSSMESTTISLNGVYYILSGNITPFLSGGVGWTWIDTNIPNGPPSNVCWYDPWWGYVCDSYVPTKTEDDWSFNAGIGIRADFTRQFGMQFGYYKMWIDMEKASDMPDFDIWRLDFVFRFGK